MKHYPSKLCVDCLISAKLFLNFAPTRLWSLWESAPLKLHTFRIIECHLLSINMWSIWLWVFPSREVHVHLGMFRCGYIVHLNRFLDVAEFTILTPLPLLSWSRLSFPVVSLKMYFFPTFTLKSPNSIVMWYLGSYRKLTTFPQKTVFWFNTFLLTWCMRSQNKAITPTISHSYKWYSVTNKFYLNVKRTNKYTLFNFMF